MIIAHLPAGYLAARALGPRISHAAFLGLIVGSLLPDLDMFWFYLVDGQQTHHHHYLTHRPAIWLALLLATSPMQATRPVAFLAMGALLHLALDSILGEIAWAWPLSNATFPLVVVPATQDWWRLSFILHWTFALELLICLAALVDYLRRPR